MRKDSVRDPAITMGEREVTEYLTWAMDSGPRKLVLERSASSRAICKKVEKKKRTQRGKVLKR